MCESNSRRSGFLVTVACASSRRLDAGVEASGPHDFAVRVSTVRQPVLPASTASRSASVTIAIRPSWEQDGESSKSDLGKARREIFLPTGLDREIDGLGDLPVEHGHGPPNAAASTASRALRP